MTSSAKARVRELSAASAPRWRSSARFSSLPAVAITRAPLRRATLQGRQADGAGAAMHQHGLAPLQAGQVHQRIVGGEIRDRQGRRSLEGEARRQRAHGERRRDDVAGEAARGERDDAVADRQVLDRRADGADRARAFHAQSWPGITVFEGFLRQQAQVPHDVAEIQPGRRNLDLDLAPRPAPAVAGASR